MVHVKDEKTGDSRKFQIVGSAEANPAEQKLSNESPIGKALMGHKRGEVVSASRSPAAQPEAQDHEDRERRRAAFGRRGLPRNREGFRVGGVDSSNRLDEIGTSETKPR